MNESTDDYQPEANPDLTTTWVQGDLIVLNENREQVHKLNESAALVFEMCRSGHSIGSIRTEFLARYEVEKRVAERDIEALLSSFRDLGLIS